MEGILCMSTSKMVSLSSDFSFLKKVLQTLKNQTDGNLICVFGCGGDRDAGKRKDMAEIASNLADINFITSDNPRNESPGKIIKEIKNDYEIKEKSQDEARNYTITIEKCIEYQHNNGSGSILLHGNMEAHVG